MPQTPHTERHFTAGEVVRDVVIACLDGLTVPLRWPQGLTEASATRRTQPRLSLPRDWLKLPPADRDGPGWLSRREKRCRALCQGTRTREARGCEIPHEEMREVAEVFQEYGLTEEQTWPIVEAPTQATPQVDRFHDAF